MKIDWWNPCPDERAEVLAVVILLVLVLIGCSFLASDQSCVDFVKKLKEGTIIIMAFFGIVMGLVLMAISIVPLSNLVEYLLNKIFKRRE